MFSAIKVCHFNNLKLITLRITELEFNFWGKRYYEDQNNERMLEDDFNKELFIIEKNNEKNQGWNPFKEFLMDHFEISEMQINYNVIYNEGFDPRVYTGDNGWYTKNRRGKNKKNSQKENLLSSEQVICAIVL